MNDFLTLDNVSFNYHSKQGEVLAVKDLSLSVKKHEFFGMVGPSGCGKTTILSLIAGMLKPQKGAITLLDKPVQECRSIIGYMLQKDHLFEWRTIEENVMLGLEIKRDKSPKSKNRVLELLEKYGLIEFKNKRPSELSGGMRQRVALIRTLALKPSVLLLDEAFSALDYQTRLNVCDDVYKIIKEEKLTAILVTHDIGEAVSLSDKVIILSQRPAHVKKEIKLNLTHIGTPFDRRECAEGKKYFDIIWRDLQ